MIILQLLAVVLVVFFGLVIMSGAPYVPTLKSQIDSALDLLSLKKGQLLVELGAGDGRVALTAAKRGWIARGYEINPLLCLIGKARCLSYRGRVKVHCRDMWGSDLSQCDGVFVFGAKHMMQRLSDKLEHELRPGAKVVSFAYKLPGKEPARYHNGIYLYQY